MKEDSWSAERNPYESAAVWKEEPPVRRNSCRGIEVLSGSSIKAFSALLSEGVPASFLTGKSDYEKIMSAFQDS